MSIWAFGTSPHGLGLTAEALWALSPREFDALREQWQHTRDYQLSMLAALRADIHNTAGKSFHRHFEMSDFMPDAVDKSVESRAKAFIAQGYTPSQAAALATSKQTKEHQLFLMDSMRGKNKSSQRKRG